MDATAGQKKTIHVFDVDGTLTNSDSLLLLLELECPSVFMRLRLWFSVLPTILTAIKKNDMGMIKLALLSKLWKGKSRLQIESTGKNLFAKKLKMNLRPNALTYINQLKQLQPNVLIVLLSASCKEWLQPLADYLQADLICTELEYDTDHRFIGRFATPNCKGPEKVKRLLQRYPASEYEFVCYADDESDKALQTISKQFFYRYF